ncbi:PREDICTED: uncharacterized mitochondrial protein AtMg00240-like [Theobroma cacao]|uniref:Uncharacterized mitochondrial protein AtMg00240-like n=1 Tax=Theobroma cacao TaxID=3641 RepID=A0AB32WNL1_THECC|nr:PREDICTED: uncharacterized mitochondrial protein AtMg00240-like [Theobroma cacao]
MDAYKPINNHLTVRKRLSKSDGSTNAYGYIYKSMIGSLLFLSAIIPDIMYATSLLSRFMQTPSLLHFKVANRILRYIKGTVEVGLKYRKRDTGELQGFSDSDWAGLVDDSKSTATNHVHWLRKILLDVGFIQKKGTVLHVDNQFAVSIAKNPIHHGRTKHI